MQRMSVTQPREYRDLLDDDRITDPEWAKLPPAERVADRLADVLFAADEILGFLNQPHAGSLRWMEREVRRMYTDVDGLMKKITD